MTWRAALSSGAVTPTSRHACWIALAISAVESASVPSQPNASRLKRRGRLGIERLRRVEAGDERLQIRGQRRLELHRMSGNGVCEAKLPGMEKHSPQPLFG